MPSTHKKVVVCKLDRDSIQGFVNPTGFVSGGKLEMLNTAGQVVTLDLADVKGVYFVRDFADPTAVATRKTFATRPRAEGLWVRMRFRDNEVMEGLMPNDLMQASPEGYLVTPPDTRSNTQRIFVPRTALLEMSVLAVIGARTAARRRAAAADARQVSMFSE
ncbi:MAG TPA: hypothetical protein VLE48_13120 [Terriglobales bacterium]|nr:hypothetical protein [Terriglobales bacterium]